MLFRSITRPTQPLSDIETNFLLSERKMSLLLARHALRHSAKIRGLVAKSKARWESTASKANTSTTSQATEGLSRVASAAGPVLNGAVNGLTEALIKVGGRTGRVVAFIQRQIPPTLYYARVGLELSKLVFHGQKMSPPPMSTFQVYYQKLVQNLRYPSSLLGASSSLNPQVLLNRATNVSKSDVAAKAVLLAELLGFFTVGEILGRRKLIGYRGEVAHH